jgi:hypothetical protein
MRNKIRVQDGHVESCRVASLKHKNKATILHPKMVIIAKDPDDDPIPLTEDTNGQRPEPRPKTKKG